MGRPSATVVIVNYNGGSFLPDCLHSLSAQTAKDFEVVVVDNGSSDGSLERVRKDFSWVKTIALRENTGFARGNNVGFEASASPYLATLNNDTLVGERWIEALLEKAEGDGRVGMVASKILLGTEGLELDSAGLLFYPDGMVRQRGRGERDEGQYDGLSEVLIPSACAALYRRSMLDEIGRFDEDFVTYCEDSDLGLRARRAGWKAVLAPDARVRHLYSCTGGKYSAFKAFQIERNHHWVLWKNLPLRYIVLSPYYRLLRYMLQVASLMTGRGSVARLAEGLPWWRLCGIMIRADLGAMAGFFRMMRKRRALWQRRGIPVREFAALLRRHRITARELMLRD